MTRWRGRACIPTPIALVLVAALCLAFAALVVVSGRLDDQDHAIAVACRGVIARLDLTEWVELCRERHIPR